MKRARHPRIECLAPGCRRGSTLYPPGNKIICAKHWRLIPKQWKRRLSLYKRRMNAADKRGDTIKADRYEDLCFRMWNRMVRFFDEPEGADEMPQPMLSELHQKGLL